MSVLTKKEKDALEEVFLSIHHNKKLSLKLRDFLKNSKLNFEHKTLYMGIFGNFNKKNSKNIEFFTKLKKFLSK